ncbi:protein smf [Legionella beliardensis]|uniref:Protein smf n=1 Tax=Legionella beliardensis TaxID=91822 RepID=A0A378I455_9GAMM|nr:DNA-processing protein DprA [Legionella beliardensis]STX29987.1 protein smf [Legionella beliardensis]
MNKIYLLALNRIPQIGPRSIKKLLGHWPSLADMFALSQLQLEAAGVPSKLAAAIKEFDFKQVDADLNWEKIPNHHLITWDDPNYPSLLKQIYDAPPILYAIGDLTCFKQLTVAMVGTHKPSVTGAQTAWQFAFDLAANQITVVSGLALGIDAQAHQGCIAAKGKTIAVLGTGIDCIYPKSHLQLANQVTDEGLLISEFPLKSPPIAGHFPRRNRIISGLSLATLVVEAAVRSGSLITARLALEQNREVMAIPGSINNPQAKGCHYLLQQGAKLVTSIHDILAELDIEHTLSSKEESAINLATHDENLVKCLGFEIATIDQIIQRSGLSIETVTCNLTELELQGIIKAVPGGYIRC